MRTAVLAEIGGADVFIAAAAVSDFKAKKTAVTKIKKSESGLELKLERTPDILGEVAGAKRDGQLIVGFAAETNDLLTNAREKLIRKRLDMVVANDVSGEGSGFDAENNTVMILRRDNSPPIELPLMSKLDIANRILDEVVELRRTNANARTASSKRS